MRTQNNCYTCEINAVCINVSDGVDVSDVHSPHCTACIG